MITIFIQNATNFDFAFLIKNLVPVGKSFFIDVAFEGELNSHGMLIDFSDAKKMIKQAISNIDHKLILPNELVTSESKRTLFASSFQSNPTNPEITEFFAISAKPDWFFKVDASIINDIFQKNFHSFEMLIAEMIKSKSPDNIKNVKVKLNQIDHSFSYTHTLCHHTGNCQKFHGHSSQLQISQNSTVNNVLSEKIKRDVNGAYFIAKSHIKDFNAPEIKKIIKSCLNPKSFKKIQNDLIAFQYKGTQGSVAILISKSKTFVLDNESTIENIAQHLFSQVSHLKNIELQIHEGSDKGVYLS